MTHTHLESSRQVQKMEAVGRLATGIAHDFNNLLTAILGYGALVRSNVGADAEVSGDVDEILKAAEKARRLTQQLLAFSRRQEIHAKAINLNDLIRDLHGMLRRLIREDVEIRLDLQSDIRAITVDPTQMEQVLLNLAVNACDAMPLGGILLIGTNDSDAGVALIVTDNGCGIDEVTRARLFEPFFTTKEPGKGTGLGLAVVLDIVQQAQGTIWVESECGRGSVFTLRFPAAASGPVLETIPAVSHVANGCGETILLVEDEDALRQLSARILRNAGYRVVEAVDGEDALQRCAGYPHSIDLLVTDVVMPKIGGIELAQRLSACRPEIRVIYMSGYSKAAVKRQNPLELNATWINKPFSPNEFLLEVRTNLDGTPAAVPLLSG